MERVPISNWCEARMQYALTRKNNLFDFGRYASVPNIGWGLGLRHEADLLCLSNNDVFHEVEIKVSMSDLKHDKDKIHNHYSKFIKYLWFAIPETLSIEKALEEIPEYSGLVQVKIYYSEHLYYQKYSKQKYLTKIIRKPGRSRPKMKLYEKPSQHIIEKFLRLGVLRMWTDTQRFNDFDKKVVLR